MLFVLTCTPFSSLCAATGAPLLPVQVVGKTTPEAPKEAFVADMIALLARVCEVDIQQDQVQVQDRLKGKYVSMSVQVMVRAPAVISRAYEEIGKDSRVKMKF